MVRKGINGVNRRSWVYLGGHRWWPLDKVIVEPTRATDGVSMLFLVAIAPQLLDSLRKPKRLRRLARIGGRRRANHGAMVTSNMKSRRRVLAKKRDFVFHEVAWASRTVDWRNHLIAAK